MPPDVVVMQPGDWETHSLTLTHSHSHSFRITLYLSLSLSASFSLCHCSRTSGQGCPGKILDQFWPSQEVWRGSGGSVQKKILEKFWKFPEFWKFPFFQNFVSGQTPPRTLPNLLAWPELVQNFSCTPLPRCSGAMTQ